MARRGTVPPLLRLALLTVLVAAVLYGAVVGYVFANQRRFLYQPDPRP